MEVHSLKAGGIPPTLMDPVRGHAQLRYTCTVDIHGFCIIVHLLVLLLFLEMVGIL